MVHRHELAAAITLSLTECINLKRWMPGKGAGRSICNTVHIQTHSMHVHTSDPHLLHVRAWKFQNFCLFFCEVGLQDVSQLHGRAASGTLTFSAARHGGRIPRDCGDVHGGLKSAGERRLPKVRG